MNFYGPIEYLTAFALVLAAGLLFGLGLGWHFCNHFREDSLRARY